MYISCTDGHTTTLLLNFDSEAYAKTGEALHACRESCRSYMNNYAHYTVSMGQSERCTEVAQIGALLQQADRAECRKLFEGSGMCLKYQAEERPDAARKAWQNKVRSVLEKVWSLCRERLCSRQWMQFLTAPVRRGWQRGNTLTPPSNVCGISALGA